MIKVTFYLRDMDSKPTLYFPDFESASTALGNLPLADGLGHLAGFTWDNKPRVIIINVKCLIFAEVEETRIGGQVIGSGQAEMPRATEVTNR